MEKLQEESISQQEVEKIKFDPRNKYSWTPDTEFIIKGRDFEYLINNMRSFLNSKEAEQVLRVFNAYQAVEKALKEAVESGKAYIPSEDANPLMKKITEK